MSTVDKLAAINSGLLRFCIQHSDFTDTRDPSKLPQRSKEDFEWLQQALASFETDVDKMKKLIQEIQTKKEGETEKEEEDRLVFAMEQLEFFCEDLDLASQFTKIDGVKPVLALLKHKSEDVRCWAAQLTATASHGEHKVQLAFFKHGALAMVLALAQKEESERVRHKLIKALSSLTEANPEAEYAFVNMRGLEILSSFLQRAASPQVKSRIIFFLTKLARTQKQVGEQAVALTLIEPLLSGAVEEDHELREKAQLALVALLPAVHANSTHALTIKGKEVMLLRLNDLLKDKNLSNEEKEDERFRIQQILNLLK